MARPRGIQIPPEEGGDPPGDEYAPDDLTEAEVLQAEVGTLFSIQGPQFEDVSWSIYRYRTRAEMARDSAGQGKPEEWVADVTGELKGSELVEMIGGGTFHFYGHVPRADGRGVKLKYNRVIRLAGPRKNFEGSDTSIVSPAVAAVPAGPSDTTRLIRLMIHERRESEQRLERLIQAVAQSRSEPAAAVKPPGLGELVNALEGMDRLRNATGSRDPDPLEMTKTMMDLFRQGIVMGQERGPVESTGEPNYMPVIEKALEVVGDMMARRQRVHPPPPGAAPRPPSQATVVETPPPAPPPPSPPAPEPETTQVQARWHTAVRSLYGAMVKGREPADFAGTLEDILDPDEIDQLAGASTDQVLEHLAPLLSEYPALSSEQGKVYLSAVLADLRESREEDAEPSPPTE